MDKKGVFVTILSSLFFAPATAFAQFENRSIYSTYSLTAVSNGEFVKRTDATTSGFDLYGYYDGINTDLSSAGRYYDYDLAASTEIYLIDRPRPSRTVRTMRRILGKSRTTPLPKCFKTILSGSP